MYIFPINPVDFGYGMILPCPDGRTVWALTPLPPDAPDDACQRFNAYLATLRELGHVVVVGGQGELALAAARELEL